MISMLVLSMVICGLEPWSGEDYTTGICCFSANHASLRSKSNTGCLGNVIMCPSGADCCFSELAL